MCTKQPVKRARLEVVLHPFVGDSEEQDGPSTGDEDRDVKRAFVSLGGSGDLTETEPWGFQRGDDHFMPTITTIRGDAMHIDIVDVHGANVFFDGHERSLAPLGSQVPQ